VVRIHAGEPIYLLFSLVYSAAIAVLYEYCTNGCRLTRIALLLHELFATAVNHLEPARGNFWIFIAVPERCD
jgi:hypothetical protein